VAGLGLLLAFVGYAAFSWGWNSATGKQQPSFVTQIFPFAK
jgi:hypothetical protein